MQKDPLKPLMDWYDMKGRIDRAFLLHEIGEYGQVVTSLLELPRSVLEEPKPAYLLGSAFASLGRKEEACEAFDRATLQTEEASYWRSCRQMKVMLEFGL